jgi:hypothetical protein
MSIDAELSGMLRKLAAMPAARRGYVLDMLGQSERDALCGLLNEAGHAALSPRLAQLVDRCRADPLPATLTRRGAEALLAAADSGEQADLIEKGLAETLRPAPLWARFLGRGRTRR